VRKEEKKTVIDGFERKRGLQALRDGPRGPPTPVSLLVRVDSSGNFRLFLTAFDKKEEV